MTVKKMRLLSLCLLIGLPFILISCFPEVDGGYPRTVAFDHNGGTKTITGEIYYNSFSLHSGSDRVDIGGFLLDSIGNVADSLITVSYDWLTVESQICHDFYDRSNILKITAQPNPDKKSRKLKLKLNFGDSYHYMYIKQEGVR